MINLGLIRNVIKDSSFYGVVLALAGAAGIFAYSIYDDSNMWKEKENGDNFITVQLSAFAPPSKNMVAEEIRKPKHKKHHKHKKKIQYLEAPPKPISSELQVMDKSPQEETIKQTQEQIYDKNEDTKEADIATTIQSSQDMLADQNIKIMRYSEGIDNAFLKAIRVAIEKRHEYPNLARQRGYEGEVLIKFLIDMQGQVSHVEVIKPSKYAILDKAAIKTIKRACRDFPRPEQTTYIEIPIGYTLARN